VRQENVFFSESTYVSGGWVNWRVECVTVNDDGSWGPYGEIASGSTQTAWGAWWQIRKWRRRLRKEALACQQTQRTPAR